MKNGHTSDKEVPTDVTTFCVFRYTKSSFILRSLERISYGR